MQPPANHQFRVDSERCIRCGECVNDCPVNILVIGEHNPTVAEGREQDCIGCQHCLAVCPTGAVSVLGLRSENSYLLDSVGLPSLEQCERLLKGRRSVRRYLDEDIDPARIRQLLEFAYHAPSGRNARELSFSVVDNRLVMHRIREQTMEGLSALAKNNQLPPGFEFFTNIVNGWNTYQADVLFRWAPHLLVVSAPEDSASPEQDGIIALSHFEIAAQCAGIGTLWNGLAKMAVSLIPELPTALNVPDGNLIVFTMSFGRPEVSYTRGAQYETIPIRIVE